MSRTDSITLSLVDIDNLIQLIAEKKPSGGVVRVIDSGDGLIIVRDPVDFLIGSFQKTVTNEGD